MAGPRHRATMGGQPTIPQVFASYGVAMAVIAAAPPQMRESMFEEFAGMLVGHAVAMQAAMAPRPVV